MTSSLGPELRARREAAGLTQEAVADRLGVARPTLSQWEAGKYRPKLDRLTKLDEIYGARGELVKLAQTGPGEDETAQPGRCLFLADVFRNVADALVGQLVVDGGRPLGWSRNLPERAPTPLSTAFVARTLQLLDDARVDLHGLAEFTKKSPDSPGWGYTSAGVRSRPEVTAVLLAALSRLGRLTDVDQELSQLEDDLDQFALSRPYVIAVVLESLLAIRPDAPLTHRLVRELLDARKPYDDRLLWTMDANVQPELVLPSPAHTARATAVLRLARATSRDKAEIDDAVGAAVDWLVSPSRGDESVIEVLLTPTKARPAKVPIHHFTPAWTIRAIAGVEGVPAPRLQAALDALWESYSPTASLWAWRDDGSLPSWMTHDAVCALRVLAEVSLPTPIVV